jgi:hypothetical protein
MERRSSYSQVYKWEVVRKAKASGNVSLSLEAWDQPARGD